jgi:tetrahydromethanopterin S-methyltransferase subunit G
MNAKMGGEFKVVHSEIKRLDQKIEAVDHNLSQRIDGVEQRLGQRIDSLDKRVDGLDKRMDVTQRLTVVEGKVRELESRR